MPFEKICDKMRELDRLIVNSNTGPPYELADKLNLSPSMVISLIDKLRATGSVIEFCNTRKSFYYKLRKPYSRAERQIGQPVRLRNQTIIAGSYQKVCLEHESYWSEGQL